MTTDEVTMRRRSGSTRLIFWGIAALVVFGGVGFAFHWFSRPFPDGIRTEGYVTSIEVEEDPSTGTQYTVNVRFTTEDGEQIFIREGFSSGINGELRPASGPIITD